MTAIPSLDPQLQSPRSILSSSHQFDPVRDQSANDDTYGDEDESSDKGDSKKRFKCSDCGLLFTRMHNLKSHALTHSREKPYICEHCNATFRRLHDLKRHQKLHTGERPFICTTCQRSFARQDALNRHLKPAGECSKANVIRGVHRQGSVPDHYKQQEMTRRSLSPTHRQHLPSIMNPYGPHSQSYPPPYPSSTVWRSNMSQNVAGAYPQQSSSSSGGGGSRVGIDGDGTLKESLPTSSESSHAPLSSAGAGGAPVLDSQHQTVVASPKPMTPSPATTVPAPPPTSYFAPQPQGGSSSTGSSSTNEQLAQKMIATIERCDALERRVQELERQIGHRIGS